MARPLSTELSPEARRRQRGRNQAIAAALMGFVILVFIITIVKLKATMP